MYTCFFLRLIVIVVTEIGLCASSQLLSNIFKKNRVPDNHCYSVFSKKKVLAHGERASFFKNVSVSRIWTHLFIKKSPWAGFGRIFFSKSVHERDLNAFFYQKVSMSGIWKHLFFKKCPWAGFECFFLKKSVHEQDLNAFFFQEVPWAGFEHLFF